MREVSISTGERTLEELLESWEQDRSAADAQPEVGEAEALEAEELRLIPLLVEVIAERGWFSTSDDLRCEGDARNRLLAALADLGVAEHAREWFAVAAQTCGALESGVDLASLSASGAGQPDSEGESGVGRPDRSSLVAAGSAVLDLIGSLTSLASHLDGARVRVAGELAVRTGRVLLADRGSASPAELTAAARTRWQSRARSTAAAEIVAFTGIRPGEAADLVNLATTPEEVSRTATEAMRCGLAPWSLVRPYFRASSDLAHEDAAHIADVLFGGDPRSAAEERLDDEDSFKDEPWNHQEFRKALDREVQAVRSRDPAAAREARERARRRRDVRVVASSDGTGQVVINGTAAQAVAVADRVERGARRARAAGDERTLGQLRSDLAMSLLLHSVLAVPELPSDPDLITTEHTDQLTQVLHALPSAQLQVIVPYSALVHAPNGAPPDPASIARLVDHLGAAATARPADGGPADGRAAHGRPHDGRAADGRPADGRPEGDPGSHARTPDPAPPPAGLESVRQSISAILASGGDVQVARLMAGAGALPMPETLAVGEAIGAQKFFLTADEVRDLALQPGTTMYRLLVDPADGRCVERSITAYAPDALMRAQIHAADVTCRAPGCVQHALYTQLDHVLEHPEGQTSEVNLQSAHQGHHDLKTGKCWRAVMDPTDRSVTWTTLLGRIYRTRVHDYRQYTRLFSDALARVESRTRAVLDDPSATDDARRYARSDAVDQAVIEALAWRGPRQTLAEDDAAGADGYQAWATTLLKHTTPDGQRRTGPLPEVLVAERERQRQSAQADSETDPEIGSETDPENEAGQRAPE